LIIDETENVPVIVPSEPQPLHPPIVASHTFDAPRERVFGAFRDPEVLARWWGPEGFSNEFREFDFRTGGAWRFTMRGPDGAEYAMDKQFVEVAEPERIVLLHPQPGHVFTLSIDFAEEGGRTRITWRMEFEDPEEAERVRDAVAAANEQNLHRLERELAAPR
jgi:uncharacterized protein YndB with AHSA1/START domain